MWSQTTGQQFELKGKVVDSENKDPLIGVNVLLIETKRGTVTDLNGEFRLNTNKGNVLRISYIGYEDAEFKVSGPTVIVNLTPKGISLDEVVVVGYGVMKKSDLTGSVSQYKNEKSMESAHTSMQDMLQGQVSGVQIVQNTGALGGGVTFNIRGSNSVTGSNQPLVVIDGYPVQSDAIGVTIGAESSFSGDTPGLNALSSLNPNDIESVEILKDASATAIYGSRGANGVVLVTTKRGKAERDRVNYSFRTDMSFFPRKIPVLNTENYIAYSNEAELDKYDGSIRYTHLNVDQFAEIDTNWQDLIFRMGSSQNHQLYMSGGEKKMKYAISLGYVTQEGIVKNTSYDKGYFRINLDRELSWRLKFGLNAFGEMSLNKAVNQASRFNNVGSSIIYSALRTQPFYNAYNQDGDDIAFHYGVTNPLILVTKAQDQSKVRQFQLSAFMNYNISKNLVFKQRAGTNNYYALRQYYMPRGTYLGDVNQGYAYMGNIRNFDYLSESTLTYNNTFNKKHSVNAVGGYTWQSWQTVTDGVNAGGFPNDNLTFYSFGSASKVSIPQSATYEWSLASFLGRINYVYNRKYLLTLTARADGSTRLAPGKKWDLFPSIALGWNVHNENFIRNISEIDEIKLRSSFGISGNQSIGVGSTVSRYGNNTGVINQTMTTIYFPANMPNSTLGWENTSQFNIGLDVSLWSSRITFMSNYYYKLTSDLLINLPIPASNGYTKYASNSGEVSNYGLELDLGARILTGKFKWKINANTSVNRNKVLKFDGTMDSFMGPVFSIVNNQPLHIAKVGYPIGAFYGYVIDGIYQTQEEINSGPVDPANPRPGSFKFVDISGPNDVPDGLISSYDRKVIGNPYPDFIFGVTNDFTWKNFNLTMFLQGSIGQDVINVNRFYLDALTTSTGSNVGLEAFQNRWTGPGSSNVYPVTRANSLPFEGRFSDFIVEDASFIRLKSVTLSYTFDLKRMKHVRSLKVFATGSNLLTISDYKGYDPEVNAQGQNSLTPGVDLGSIPQFRTFSSGFNISF